MKSFKNLLTSLKEKFSELKISYFENFSIKPCDSNDSDFTAKIIFFATRIALQTILLKFYSICNVATFLQIKYLSLKYCGLNLKLSIHLQTVISFKLSSLFMRSLNFFAMLPIFNIMQIYPGKMVLDI